MSSNVCLQESLEFNSSRSKGQVSSKLHPLRSNWPKRVPQRRCLVWCNCWRARWTWISEKWWKVMEMMFLVYLCCVFFGQMLNAWKVETTFGTPQNALIIDFSLFWTYLYYLNANKLSIARFCLIRRQCQIPTRSNFSGALAAALTHVLNPETTQTNMLLKKNQTNVWIHESRMSPTQNKIIKHASMFYTPTYSICFPATVSSETRRFTGQYFSGTSSSRVDVKTLLGSMRMGMQKARRWCSCCLVWPNWIWSQKFKMVWKTSCNDNGLALSI